MLNGDPASFISPILAGSADNTYSAGHLKVTAKGNNLPRVELINMNGNKLTTNTASVGFFVNAGAELSLSGGGTLEAQRILVGNLSAAGALFKADFTRLNVSQEIQVGTDAFSFVAMPSAAMAR
jgi:hypothetical protein